MGPQDSQGVLSREEKEVNLALFNVIVNLWDQKLCLLRLPLEFQPFLQISGPACMAATNLGFLRLLLRNTYKVSLNTAPASIQHLITSLFWQFVTGGLAPVNTGGTRRAAMLRHGEGLGIWWKAVSRKKLRAGLHIYSGTLWLLMCSTRGACQVSTARQAHADCWSGLAIPA